MGTERVRRDEDRWRKGSTSRTEFEEGRWRKEGGRSYKREEGEEYREERRKAKHEPDCLSGKKEWNEDLSQEGSKWRREDEDLEEVNREGDFSN